MSTNLLDLWAEPKFNSERASQLLFGEIVRVSGEKNGYCRIYQEDDYSGWADRRHLTTVPGRSAQSCFKGSSSVVAVAKATLYSTDMKPSAPYCLYYGTRLMARSFGNGLRKVVLPDKTQFLVSERSLSQIGKPKVHPPTGTQIVTEAKKFLGVPYLWGGVTTCGFDCSGFVRAIYARFGIYLPRDTKDQITVGREVAREETRTGDLVFFERHVGLAIGSEAVIHASLGGSGVRINSLTPRGAAYRPDLDRTFKTARRIL